MSANASTILATEADRNTLPAIGYVASPGYHVFIETKQLVLLYSWQFECTDVGTFRDYVQRINVSTMGTVEELGHPPVLDTGHIPITVLDRAGVEENVWYRSPCVPLPLTRDPLTYHSADQCRRVTPETGAEDVTYAAAFECGRLLAAADPRLAQELMRWRRESYRQSVRTDSLIQIQATIPLNQALDIHQPVASVVALNAAGGIVTGITHIGDKYGLSAIEGAPGLNPAEVQQAWNLASAAEATAILGGEPGATGVVVNAPAQTARSATTLAAVAADSASLSPPAVGPRPGPERRATADRELDMRTPWIESSTALKERLRRPIQLDVTEAESEMPPYMELFLSHLRLLVGVPFDYLCPDDRLLPDESIRFFYIDRSWTDRLVDGAVAVGKIGTREQAHHQGHAPAVNQQVDLSERIVRIIQRGRQSFTDAKAANDQNPAPADTITGFLLRSSAVSGWPQMDVRAYKTDVPEPFDPADPKIQPLQLPTLRLELLSPGVMIAIFQGVPQLVILEEPHNGVHVRPAHRWRRRQGLSP